MVFESAKMVGSPAVRYSPKAFESPDSNSTGQISWNKQRCLQMSLHMSRSMDLGDNPQFPVPPQTEDQLASASPYINPLICVVVM